MFGRGTREYYAVGITDQGYKIAKFRCRPADLRSHPTGLLFFDAPLGLVDPALLPGRTYLVCETIQDAARVYMATVPGVDKEAIPPVVRELMESGAIPSGEAGAPVESHAERGSRTENQDAALALDAALATAPDGGVVGCVLILGRLCSLPLFWAGVVLGLPWAVTLGGALLVSLDLLFVLLSLVIGAGLISSGAWMQIGAMIVGAAVVTPWWNGIMWGSAVLALLTVIPWLQTLLTPRSR
jgi:hypothetical protein